MATIFVGPSSRSQQPETLLEVLNLSECHYILRRRTVFITAEMAVRTCVTSQSLRLCVHGQVLTDDATITQHGRGAYERLFERGQLKLTDHENGVFDFVDSFYHQGATNKGYEAPPPNHQIEPIEYPGKLKYCGIEAETPECEYTVKTDDKLTVITIKKKGGSFEAGKLYVWRLGYFLHHPATVRIGWWRRVWKPQSFTYTFHIFSIPTDVAQPLSRFGIDKSNFTRSRLYLDITPWISPEEAKKKNCCELDATSDIWWIVHSEDDFGEVDESADHVFDVKPDDAGILSPVECRYVLYSDQHLRGRKPYKEYHLKLKESVREFKDKNFTHGQLDGGSIAFSGTISAFSLHKVIGSYRSNLSVVSICCALAVAVGNFVVTSRWEPLAFFLAVVVMSIVLAAAICLRR